MKAEYDALIQQAAVKYLPGIDWRLLKAQLFQESGLNPKAVSPAGAQGIAQFMPATWADVSKRAGYEGMSAWDPEAAIPVAAFYMAELRAKWKAPRPDIDRHCLAMASYNAGFGNILKAQEKAGGAALYAPIIAKLHLVTSADGDNDAQETTNYCQRILGFYNQQVLQG